MADDIEGAGRFLAQVEALRAEEGLFDEFYLEAEDDRSIANLRRRRRRAANTPDSLIKTVSLVDEGGVLYWRDGIPTRTPRVAGRRRRAGVEDTGELIYTKEFPVLAPNKVIDAIGALDRRLNKAIDGSLRSRLRELKQTATGAFQWEPVDSAGPFTDKTLLLVHGTFSNAENMLNEFKSGPGLRFLNRVTRAPTKYKQILFFDHPTLAVSPVINALELGRALAGSTGQIDVIAHSRGGLIVRWWLEAFGTSLGTAPKSRVRAIFAGSPLHGTSLAAPDRIRHAMSLVSNIGTYAEKTMGLVGVANPFLWVAGKLVEVIVSVAGALAKTPLVDALTALVPGLAGQSAVTNNHEINRLRLGPVAMPSQYYAVQSNFETQNPGWRFWRNFRKDRMGDLAADIVFPGDNDLVVDTPSMADFGVPKVKLAAKPCDFGKSDTVWHCNYFRQEKTIKYIADAFQVSLT